MKMTKKLPCFYIMIILCHVLIIKIESCHIETKSKRSLSLTSNKIGKFKTPSYKQGTNRFTKVANFFGRFKSFELKEQSHNKKINYFHLRQG